MSAPAPAALASLHGWLISPIWQYFSFWFIIAHATCEVAALPRRPQSKPNQNATTHTHGERAKKAPNWRINSNTRWTNTMFCRAHNTPDVGEFPLTACEYELFDSTSICLPARRCRRRFFIWPFLSFFSLSLCEELANWTNTHTHVKYSKEKGCKFNALLMTYTDILA